MTLEPPLLSVRDYSLVFDTFDGVYNALDRVSFAVRPGESLGIVGETGCGKSVAVKSVLGLVPTPPGRVTGGEIVYDGQDMLRVSAAGMRRIRGMEISMIFQDPMTYLNPVFSIGQQLTDIIKAHQRVKAPGARLDRKDIRAHAIAMLRKVHLPNPERQLEAYPHQLSGGMRQRVLIAMALSGNPRLLIADEPTTALDVTIQAQILDLIVELVDDLGLSVILISHDLGVVAKVCDRVIVMYAGQIVEDAATDTLFRSPKHPYTQGLLKAVPHPGKPPAALSGIPGTLPNLYAPPAGCRFRPRCPMAEPLCAEKTPSLTGATPDHSVACHVVARETADA